MSKLRRPGQHPTTVNGVISYEIEWESMQVGQSFFIPTHDPTSIRSQLYWQGRQYGYNLVFRDMYHGGLFGLMTWRGADDVLEPQSD